MASRLDSTRSQQTGHESGVDDSHVASLTNAVGSAGVAPDNAAIARCLDELADRLDARSENPFRVRAYRRAARVIRAIPDPVAALVEREGTEGLDRLPGIGPSLARTVEQLARTGHVTTLDRLRAETSPAQVLGTVAGIGPETAERIHEQLGIQTLPDLLAAAIDGRLAKLPGMGRKRVQSVIECLTGRARQAEPPSPRPAAARGLMPPVAELLDVDREYRERAAAGQLQRIAPRRFNPTGAAWLPILHTRRGERRYTVLFSNTARAHELDATRDWVVLYVDDRERRYQCTVITSRFGSLAGRRIIRGREAECRAYYARPHGQLDFGWDGVEAK